MGIIYPFQAALESSRRHFRGRPAIMAPIDEDRLDILKPGGRAELIIVDRDLFQVSPRAPLGA
ncbi:MAG TPA: hypothetical protein VKP69_30985, partial [Isosphaeraceae bacterium]|nr:hypothetical protein [Isosphaeraceae bacterium]